MQEQVGPSKFQVHKLIEQGGFPIRSKSTKESLLGYQEILKLGQSKGFLNRPRKNNWSITWQTGSSKRIALTHATCPIHEKTRANPG